MALNGDPRAASAPPSAPPLASAPAPKPPPRRKLLSPLTRRILTVNILALGILVAGLLYLGQYRENLIDSELQALSFQGEIFAGALGQGARGVGEQAAVLQPDIAGPMLRRLVQPTRTRARLFGADGALIVDSRVLMGPGGVVKIEVLPPPAEGGALTDLLFGAYDTVAGWLPRRHQPLPYREQADQHATHYEEAMAALTGNGEKRVRVDGDGRLVLSATVPVQRFKHVLGALMLTTGGHAIEGAVREVRLDILKVFLVALGVTVLLSLYLAGTIVRPLRRLAAAAERVRLAQGREHAIPDFRHRGDEIGDLSIALGDMTEALWRRVDAIESFAADVAHEIKNPLTSLRSAVETAARISDPDQQRRLMAIILDDVQRLDRLITDISDASRLDAELSRAEMAPVDVGRLLAALVEVHEAAAAPGRPAIAFAAPSAGALTVIGNEGRLAQVFQNLIANAMSFSPGDGTVTMTASRGGDMIEVAVEDEGPGIPDGSLDSIFERFYSERPEGEQFGTHSGLGLSIARQVVEAHGGSIMAENRRRADGAILGARFRVRLPAG